MTFKFGFWLTDLRISVETRSLSTRPRVAYLPKWGKQQMIKLKVKSRKTVSPVRTYPKVISPSAFTSITAISSSQETGGWRTQLVQFRTILIVFWWSWHGKGKPRTDESFTWDATQSAPCCTRSLGLSIVDAMFVTHRFWHHQVTSTGIMLQTGVSTAKSQAKPQAPLCPSSST